MPDHPNVITPAANPDMKFDHYLLMKKDDHGRLIRYTISSDLDLARTEIQQVFDKSIKSLVVQNDDLGDQLAKTKSSFGKFLHRYSENIKGFYHLVSLDSFIRGRLRKSYFNNTLIDFADDELVKAEERDDILIYGIPIEKLSKTTKRARAVGEFFEGTTQIPSLLLLGLVARFDAHLSSFVRLLLRDRPEAIGSRQSEFDLATVLQFNDIEDLKDLFIDQEVYRLMHASHHEQVLFIEQTFHVALQNKFMDNPKFLEIFERRNLVAHGEGEVNSRYTSRCKLYKVPPEMALNKSDAVEVDSDYLLSSIDTIYKFGYLLIWSLWTKRHKEEADLSYEVVLETTFDLMLEERYGLVSDILGYVLNHHIKDSDDLHLRMFAVNKSICDKHLGVKDWQKPISEFKWGSSTANFKICIAAVEEDIDLVCRLMRQVSAESIPLEMRVGAHQFREWPAFHWVRTNQAFLQEFRETFGEDFGSESPDSDEEEHVDGAETENRSSEAE